MNRTLLWLIVAVVFVIGSYFFQSRSAGNLDVDENPQVRGWEYVR